MPTYKKLTSKHKCNTIVSFRTIASKHEYNAMASFQTTANIGKTRDKYCLLFLYIWLKLGFWHLLPKLINVGILIRCEGVGKNLKINKRPSACIKHPRVLLAKSKLNNIEVLISKALIDSNNSHNKFALINNVLKEFYDMKEETKNSINK